MADSYTTLFSIRPKGQQSKSDLLAAIVSDVLAWARTGGVDLATSTPGRYEIGSGEECDILADSCPEGEYWRLRWSHPDRDGRPVSWVSDVRLATVVAALEVEFSAQVRVVSDPGAATPERVAVGTPRLIKEVIDRHDAGGGARPLRGSSVKVSVGDAERFVREDVLAPDRVLPILVVSPRAEDNSPYVTAEEARRFVGLAEVYFLETAATTRLVSDSLGSDFACYNGAVRLWWPGIDAETDDPRHHQLWLPARVGESPTRALDQIYNLVSRVAERRAADGGPIWQQAFSAASKAREERYREALASAELVDLADEVEEDLRAAREEVRRYATENESLRGRLDQLTNDVSTLEERLAEAYRITSQLPKESQPVSQPDITSALDAVEAADGRFRYLKFSEESRRSAERSLFRRPEEVYRAFQVLDELGDEMARQGGSLGEALYARLRNENLNYVAQESPTTVAQWAAQRRATHDGTPYEMQRHLRWGGPSRESQHHLRLYFVWEPAGPYWVIGHVGDHPTNTQS